MTSELHVLIVEDSKDDLLLLTRTLRALSSDLHVECVETPEALVNALATRDWDVVISDYAMPHMDGCATLAIVRSYSADLPFIIVPGTIGEETAVAAMKAGASDYVMKHNLSRLVPAVERELREADVRRQKARIEQTSRDVNDHNRALIAMAAEGIITFDERGIILSFNPAAERLFGYEAIEVLGGHLSVVLPHHDDRCRNDASDSEPFVPSDHDGYGSSIETVGARSDGGRVPVELAISRTELNGRALYTCIVKDLTERKRTEEEQRAIMASVRCMIWYSDVWENQTGELKWDLKPLNVEAAQRMLPLDTPPGTDHITAWVLSHVDNDRARMDEFATAMVRKGQSYSQEFRCRNKDGDIQWLREDVHVETVAPRKWRVVGVTTDITERKRAEMAQRKSEEELQRQFERLYALRAIDVAITGSFDIRVTLSIVLDQVTTLLRVDAADILLVDVAAAELRCASARGFYSNAIQHARVALGQGLAGRAVIDQQIVQEPDLNTNPSFCSTSHLAAEGFVSYYAIPLVAKGTVHGILEVFQRSTLDVDADWLSYLETLAGQAAIAIDSTLMFAEVRRQNAELTMAYDRTIEGWARALDLRDKETEGHSRRVTDLTVAFARAVQMDEAEIAHARRGALLHDIGKLGVPDAILLKPGSFTDEERAMMQKHVEYAHEWLAPIPFLRPALDIPSCHHEKWDGSGYPRGLKGTQIPLSARLFAFVDVWDALLSDRSYRAAWTKEQAVAFIRENAGSHFDPDLVETFIGLVTSVAPSEVRPHQKAVPASIAAPDADEISEACATTIELNHAA